MEYLERESGIPEYIIRYPGISEQDLPRGRTPSIKRTPHLTLIGISDGEKMYFKIKFVKPLQIRFNTTFHT